MRLARCHPEPVEGGGGEVPPLRRACPERSRGGRNDGGNANGFLRYATLRSE
ncbi:MAG: hypothetical protein LBK47_02665 [Prevotellaceae bacterium]|nr:hypothetical protein [Prevotellaceae bacterium]